MYVVMFQAVKKQGQTPSHINGAQKLLPAVNKTKIQAVVFCFDGMTFSRL